MKLADKLYSHPSLDRLEKQLFDLTDLYRKHQVFIKEKYKVSALEMEILQLVCLEGPKKMKEIGEHFQVKLSTLTSIIDKIEQGRLVKRVNSQEDRRVVFLEATKKGKGLYKEYGEHIQLVAQRMQESLTQDQFQALIVGMDQVSQLMVH